MIRIGMHSGSEGADDEDTDLIWNIYWDVQA